MSRTVILEYSNEDLSFSAGHFAIFSEKNRENLHGHNYRVFLALTVELSKNGLNFDCRDYQKKVYDLCQELNLSFLLPNHSPYLQIEEEGDQYTVYFRNEKIPFLKRDVILLPLANISIEELAHWFLQRIIQNLQQLNDHGILEVLTKVSSYPGIAAIAKWRINSLDSVERNPGN